MDMIGNIWEWTSSLHRSYPYRASDGREDPDTPVTGVDRRVTRGGSYPYTQARIDSMARNDMHPNTRALNVGFRVTCRPRSNTSAGS
jgi:formylglycine-generating enzyme required for sulfatase activity